MRLEPEDMSRGYTTEPHPYIAGALMIAHKANGECVYLGDKGCTIHDGAPALCRAADCRSVAARFDFETAKTLHVMGRLDFRVWDRGRELLQSMVPVAERKKK